MTFTPAGRRSAGGGQDRINHGMFGPVALAWQFVWSPHPSGTDFRFGSGRRGVDTLSGVVFWDFRCRAVTLALLVAPHSRTAQEDVSEQAQVDCPLDGRGA